MRTGIISATILVLLASVATADVTLSIIDATLTARNDGTLPGIGETIFSADVFAEVTPGDFWTVGGVLGATLNGAVFYRTFDPNGDVRMTAPGFGTDATEFATFVSFPDEQLARSRFGERSAPQTVGFRGPGARLEETYVDIAYLEQPSISQFGSGFTQRLTIDTSATPYRGTDVYLSTSGPRDPNDVWLAGFGSAAVSAERPSPLTEVSWGYYAVPEPQSLLLMLSVVCLSARLRL